MVAQPSDIARFTNDGFAITNADATVRASDMNAIDATGSTGKVYSGSSEQELFFDALADGQTVQAQRFAMLKIIGRWHEQVELEDSLGLGRTIPLAPNLPTFTTIDDTRGLNKVLATRSFAFDFSTDRYAIELVQVS